MTPLLHTTHGGLIPLVHVLKSLPSDESARTIASNLALVTRLASYQYFVPLLREIVSDARLLAEIASRSYRHVNYFDKIVLVDSANPGGYRLTLHLWVPPFTDRELKKESLHDHRF